MNRRVRAGAGALWSDITTALAEYGLVGLAGSAGDVGIVGYTLGGGYSWLGREHGLAASAVHAIEAILDAAGPGVESPFLVVDVRVLGGAFGRPSPRGGVVDHLDGRFLLNAVGITPTPEAVTAVDAALRSLLSSIDPWRAEFDYANFCSTDSHAYYSDDALVRLRAVKSHVDPAGIIHAAHGF